MAGNHEIKIDYSVVNSSFNKGIKEISSQVTSLNKEFKLQKEQMKLTASESEKLEASLQKLNKEHELAQQKTRLVESAYKNVVEVMGENSKEAETWKNKLLDAQKNEAYLSNAIQITTDALEKSNASMSEAAQQSDENRTKLKALEDQQKNLALESQKLASEINLEKSEMSDSATETEKLEKAKESLGKQAELVGRQIENLEEQLKIAKDEYGENSDEVLKLETALNESKSAFNDLNREMEQTSGASSQASEGLSGVMDYLNYDMVLKFSEKLGELSEKLIELGQKSLEAFREVDEGMDTVTTKTGASGQALEEMQGIVSDLATTIPTDFATAGNAVGELNTQFGFTGDKLREASDQMIKYAEINGTDVTNASLDAKKAIEAYGLSAEDLGSVLDTTTYVAQQTGVSVDDLMRKAIDGAPQIKALGLSFDEGVTLMGQFEQAGIDSSQALTYMSKATVKYAKDGLTLEQGLKKTISQIKNAKTETEKVNIAAEVFGQRGATKMVEAIERGTLSFEDLAETAKNAGGTVSGTFEETLDPIDKFQTAQNQLTEVLAELGNLLAETLAPALDVVSEALKGALEWFKGLPEPVKKIIVVIGLIVTALGLVLPVVLPIVAAIQFGLIPVIVGLISASLPIIGVIAAIIAIIAAVIIAIQNWGAISEWLTNVWEGFKSRIMQIWDTVKSYVVEKANAMKDGMVKSFNSAKDTVFKIWDSIKDYISKKIDQAKEAVGKAIEGIKKLLDFEWKWPKIPIPKIVVTGHKKILGMSIPNLGIQWNALGGIFKRPTVIGEYGGALQGVGEAGPEAVIPLNREVLASIGVGVGATMSNDEIVALLEETNYLLDNIARKDTTVHLNNRVIAEEIRQPLNELNELYDARRTRIRGRREF